MEELSIQGAGLQHRFLTPPATKTMPTAVIALMVRSTRAQAAVLLL